MRGFDEDLSVNGNICGALRGLGVEAEVDLACLKGWVSQQELLQRSAALRTFRRSNKTEGQNRTSTVMDVVISLFKTRLFSSG